MAFKPGLQQLGTAVLCRHAERATAAAWKRNWFQLGGAGQLRCMGAAAAVACSQALPGRPRLLLLQLPLLPRHA